MTELATYKPLDVNAVAKATTPELRKELSKALSITADHFTYLGAIWRELERRGENLSELKSGMGYYLAKIANGELLADTVVKYAGEPGILRRMGALPLDKQRAALTTGKLPFETKKARPRKGPGRCRADIEAEEEEDDDLGQLPDPMNFSQKIVAMAKAAGAADLAETILSIVKASENPADVAARVLPEIEIIVNRKPRRAV